ncbi:GATA transcription factor 8-like [Vigna unguiculata]|uniref:GATA transcription factor 8-like n=1 Tax=Vigna unguiculata TaxID=3917 RepID=UPI001015FF05|nr:GATA transcription factor 8-like [Vigna unguiculata]XP_027925001.1 GATA transcription factor 8-like [Vigna unguiculata]
MIGNFIDDIDCGSFFDHIDDLLEFPEEETAVTDTTVVTPVAPPTTFWPAESDSLHATNTVFSGNTVPDLSTELSVPFEDIVQLEWLSNFVEDSFSGGSLTMQQEQPQCTNKEDTTHAQFQTASPVSVLESSTFSSREKAASRGAEIYIPVPCGRARSKRARPVVFNPHPVMQLISSASSTGENTHHNTTATSKTSSDSENFAESTIKTPKQVSGDHKKKKKIKVTFSGGEDHNAAPSQTVRKCVHCEITKTPQWRAGPMGPKTLCNACGVRYKSGRLFPEYRPAASPTFCAAVHSNSHKKVLEMRNKTVSKSGFAADSESSPELIPNTNTSLSLEYM